MHSQYIYVHVRFRSAHLKQVINSYGKIDRNNNVAHGEYNAENKKQFIHVISNFMIGVRLATLSLKEK